MKTLSPDKTALKGDFLKLFKVASDKTSNSNWFGILFSCSDTKKKSNLMLALFEPGNTPVPWVTFI